MDMAVQAFVEELEIHKILLKNKIMELSLVPDIVKDKTEIGRLKLEVIETSNLIRILRIPSVFWPQYKELFTDFSVLNRYLTQFSFDARGKMRVLFHLLEKNIATGILDENAVVIDSHKMKDANFKDFSNHAVQQVVQDDINLKGETDLCKYETDVSSFVFNHRLLWEHYFSKRNTYSEEDIINITSALNNLGIDKEFVEVISYILKNQLKKRNQAKQEFNFVFHETKKEKPTLSNKDYNKILKEIRKYYDPVNSNLVYPLNWEEAIYCASLLMRIDAKDYEIKLFFKEVEKEQEKKLSNPVALYNSLYPRLKYYAENNRAPDANFIPSLEDIFQEFFIVSDEDYEFWKDSLKQELDCLLPYLPKNYEYERNCAKQLLKSK